MTPNQGFKVIVWLQVEYLKKTLRPRDKVIIEHYTRKLYPIYRMVPLSTDFKVDMNIKSLRNDTR